ncbi:hypothetical protein LBMAG21_03480 [Armatimonadota bacterium]|nr:hypothetical protein LBMAG21_03480 [Armatimonadota bacterium]
MVLQPIIHGTENIVDNETRKSVPRVKYIRAEVFSPPLDFALDGISTMNKQTSNRNLLLVSGDAAARLVAIPALPIYEEVLLDTDKPRTHQEMATHHLAFLAKIDRTFVDIDMPADD